MTALRRRKIYDTTLRPRRGRSWRDLAGWLGAVLLAFNLAAPGWAPGAPVVVDAFGEAQVICTAHLAEGGGVDLPPQQPSSGCPDCCPCCLPLAVHGGALVPATAAVLPPERRSETVAVVPTIPPAVPARRPHSAAPRAPPAA